MKHTKRRKLTVEDFNRALRWSNVEVSEQERGQREAEAVAAALSCPQTGASRMEFKERPDQPSPPGH